jgi:hypothetical protein
MGKPASMASSERLGNESMNPLKRSGEYMNLYLLCFQSATRCMRCMEDIK